MELEIHRGIMKRRLHGNLTYLIPLTLQDLEDQLINPKITAERYDLKGALEPPDDHMKKILEIKLAKMKAAPELSVFSTYFLIVEMESHEILGTIGYKGAPDEDGTIEVGYGIRPGFREKGFMTDALKAFTEFGLTLPGVLKIVACTNKDNGASIRVLEKSGYKRIYTAQDLFVWRYPAQPPVEMDMGLGQELGNEA
ncbi:GNAT family N-acetyltransferase [Acidaminobacter hydrogenoformans]|uniref:Protein N-acetyltransferase, RimJ/RimL family n=1 Tax=Acidaminobacter hydrogenoformans DSM 2784 TaxID=1120920 RepID=A0A1G5S6Y9_9FIRM|nr:GNAT family N-acetyltransferase [Acidaminobacter hydrogenoformans]SCZ81481.1 Protein N-acetyltransferase, RimJ/RimL family [Acidaminobacter hydrogenoformans DSM 2784]